MKQLILVLIFLFFSPMTYSQSASDPYDLPKIVAVENKAFNPKYDITANLGILPIDAFYKAMTLGVSYSYSYTSYLSWEVINANLATPEDTNLKKDLINNFSVRPQGILDNVRYYATSNVIYSPIYSKNLLFNEKIVHGEMSFLAGGGVVGFSSGETAPMYGGGIILRFFHNQLISYKMDGRLYFHSGQNKSSDMILSIAFGVSFELGSKKSGDTQYANY